MQTQSPIAIPAIIRTAGMQDAPRLADFNIRMAFETENLKLAPQVAQSGVQAVLANPARGFYVVAEVESQVVASLLVTTEWSDWRNGELWWIQSVYVTREWRRRGLYRMMYAHVKQRAARAENVRGFRLYVERDNQIAQQTYRTLGMNKTHYDVYEQLV